ncbi:MAG: hypothetical protein J6D03_07035 [Clostridia bacterium]|nr:hypothetical protein [Clostridia bacterium]
MSFNKQISGFKVLSEKTLKERMETILLSKDSYKKNYHQLEEFTGFIEKIEPSEKKEDMWKLTLVFKNGERATTHAYLDDKNIKEETIVSIIGYVTKYGGEYQLYCRGITPIYTSIEELAESNPDLNKFVKVSLFINLSNIEETRVFREDETIQPLGNTGYYYKVVQKIENMNNEQKMNTIVSLLNNMPSRNKANKEVVTNNVETNNEESTVVKTNNLSYIDEIENDFPDIEEI